MPMNPKDRQDDIWKQLQAHCRQEPLKVPSAFMNLPGVLNPHGIDASTLPFV